MVLSIYLSIHITFNHKNINHVYTLKRKEEINFN
jgi:hypothetical protein